MTEVALIIGNGLDLDLGIKSSYRDFANSKEWKELMDGYRMSLIDVTSQNNSLLWQINLASKDSQWFDIEEEIHKFINSHPNLTEHDIRHVESEFKSIKKALCKYLKRSAKDYKTDNKKISRKLLYFLSDCPYNVYEFNFNYTNVNDFLGDSYRVLSTHIHGNLEDDDIVLGCDIQENEVVNRDLSFLYKYNMLNKANHIVANMLAAKEVIIFGHSINEMDFCYFREYLKVASSSSQQTRYLTIFTYDEQSERDIKDNMRNQGISVSDIYNNLDGFTFIHTKNYYEGDKKEDNKLQDLVIRLQQR